MDGPGGGIEEGESSLEAAVREVEEETGLDIEDPEAAVARRRSFGARTAVCEFLSGRDDRRHAGTGRGS
ncbi:MAG: NUDIX domain-containing protein [Clostridia bacterium]